jgi:biotin-(acetyl-CoA carboxylase) ligase
LNFLVGRPVVVPTFRDALLPDFFSRYDEFLAVGFPLIREEYRQRCGFLGREISVRDPLDCIQGIARDITAAGELELELADGERRHLALGEIVCPGVSSMDRMGRGE